MYCTSNDVAMAPFALASPVAAWGFFLHCKHSGDWGTAAAQFIDKTSAYHYVAEVAARVTTR